MESCAEKTTRQEIGTCSLDVFENVLKKLQEIPSTATPEQKTKFLDAARNYESCVYNASTILNSEEQKLSSLKDCANELAVQGKSALNCN